MDPIQNPYAPGAGQRPPALTGRDDELAAFDVVLARVAKGRPERSMVLTGLRGVGKTVLLNTLRSSAVRAGWGTGKLEARPGQSLRRPLGAALHMAVRELGHPSQTETVLGTVRSFVEADAKPGTKLRDRWNPGIAVPRPVGAPTPATSRSTWSRCSPTWAAWPWTSGQASRSTSTRCRTSSRRTSRRCARPATNSASRGCR
nr:ATP-binding protein [Raineyella fluvialis]